MNEPVLITENTTEEEKNNLSLTDTVFAWICLISAYLFCRVSPINDSPAGGFLLIIFLYVITTVFLALKGGRFNAMAVISALSAVILSFGLILTYNPVIHFFSYTYALITYLYFVYASFGNSLKKGFCDLVTIDCLKALFVLPFAGFGSLFTAVFSGKKGGKTFRRLLLGVAIAIIPTAIVLSLLSYDAGFTKLMDKIFDFDFADIWSHFVSFNLAIPLSAFGYGLFVSASKNKCKDNITAESCSKVSEKIKFAPIMTVLAATLPILAVYVIFFISQWKYYISGFTGVLPKGFVYSEYAREGFFQLCAVSVINLVVIALIMSFTKRRAKAESVTVKILSILYSLATLVLISTALAKMIMYINIYGLTPKRVYAAWFEIVLAIVFLLVILKQFIPKFNVIITSLTLLVVCFSVLALANTDGIIADYNVDKYLDGSLESIDVQMLADLGDPAIPALVRLEEAARDKDEWVHKQADYRLTDAAIDHLNAEEDEDIFSYTIPTYRAKALLNDRIEEERESKQSLNKILN